MNIRCDPNWWARLFHGDSSCSCIGHYSDESGDKWQEDAMKLEWGTVCETLEWEPRIGRNEPRGTGPRRSAQMDKVLCVVILAPEDGMNIDEGHLIND